MDEMHEPFESLSEDLLDRHRAIRSLMEELEAVDWYDQRIQGARDPELKRILAHNRDEEKEHACMVIEWLRRNDAAFAEQIGRFVGREGPILESHGGPETGSAAASPEGDAAEEGSLRIGSLKGEPLK